MLKISGRDISVDYKLTGTATGSGIDYNLDNGTLIIDAGENTGIITIPSIIDDDLAEGDETIIMETPSGGSGGSSGGGGGTKVLVLGSGDTLNSYYKAQVKQKLATV